MFRYNTRAFDKYNRTVVSLAVLTDKRPDWRPDRFEYGDWGATTGIRFLTAKLLDWRGREAELDASANPFARVTLAHLQALATRQDPEGRRHYKLQLTKGLYQHGWTAEDVRQLFRVIDWILDLPSELQRGFQEELHAWEEEKRMPYITSVERHMGLKGCSRPSRSYCRRVGSQVRQVRQAADEKNSRYWKPRRASRTAQGLPGGRDAPGNPRPLGN